MKTCDFQTAPATWSVRTHPANMLAEAKRSMEKWSEQLRHIDNLLSSPLVVEADKITLRGDRGAARACLMACANIVAACEKEMRQQRANLERKWGWLL